MTIDAAVLVSTRAGSGPGNRQATDAGPGVDPAEAVDQEHGTEPGDELTDDELKALDGLQRDGVSVVKFFHAGNQMRQQQRQQQQAQRR